MSLLATSTFDTRGIALPERFSAWRDSIDVIFDTKLDEHSDPLAFNARMDASMFGDVVIGRLASDTQAFARPQTKILADGLDAYLVQVFTRGTCSVQDGRHTRIVRPGDIYIIDASAPLDAVDYGFEHITAMIPRDMISRNLARPDGHHRRVIPAEMPLAKLLYAYVCTLSANRTQMTASDGVAAIAPLLSLIESILNAPVPGAVGQHDGQAVEFAVLNTIKDHIETNLSNRDMTPDTLATIMGMSRSRLYRLFEQMGGVSKYIRQRRLRRSLQDLLDQSHRTMRIGEIAWRWGFGSESDFSRAFKQRYGVNPSEARDARSRRGTTTQTSNSDYERWVSEMGT
ncbi:helix-turn-helix domain-containing protein [Puniceibacterium sediminis]|uniref:Transcriptional regulator, AraC family n=1 Tax=Puniceibacterium sediminis TaxID=1608407 RepID=A0A238ZUC4_9RHOB|nr:helix-turn-helix domain-containing protein [Puniceibacterium sediminis]SNR87026.1 transcriptional regulator, AraC family [Puniceibacterium sediminis]